MADALQGVLFDLGRVLVDFDHTIAARRISPHCGKTPEEIFQLFFCSPVTVRFEEGRIAPRDFFDEVRRMLDLRIGYDEFLPIWNEIFFMTDDNRAVQEIKRTLAGRYRLAMLSNVNILHFEYLKRTFDLFAHFDRLFLSYEMGMIKPDPRIYRQAVDAMGLTFDDVLYVDDRADLVEAAQRQGVRAYRFTSAAALREELMRLGVPLVPAAQA